MHIGYKMMMQSNVPLRENEKAFGAFGDSAKCVICGTITKDGQLDLGPCGCSSDTVRLWRVEKKLDQLLAFTER